MFRIGKGRLARLALAVGLGLTVTACGTVGNNERMPEPPSAYDRQGGPSAGIVAPDHIGRRQLPTVPLVFPVLTEESNVASYLKTMLDIHAVALKNPQKHEWRTPPLVAVTGSEHCRRPGAVWRVGDSAKPSKSAPVAEIAACDKGGRPVIKYSPKMVYQLRLGHNRHVIETAIFNAYADYLVAKVREINGSGDRLVGACARGRLVGGLRDHNYLLPQRANSIHQTVQGVWKKVFITARETGKCPAELLGNV